MKQSLFCRSTDILLVKIQSNVEMIRGRYQNHKGSYVTCSSNKKLITKCTMPNLTHLYKKINWSALLLCTARTTNGVLGLGPTKLFGQ